MYIPSTFRESDRAVLFDFIEAHSLGALVSAAPGGETTLYATHLPFWLDRERGVLEGHLALTNPHAKYLAQLGGGHAGTGDVHRAKRLHLSRVVSQQARAWQGGSDLELYRRPCAWGLPDARGSGVSHDAP